MDIKAETANGNPTTPTSIYDLGDSILYAEFGELHSKITSEHIHIEKKVCEVFECLAKQPNEVVTRQYIFDHVWSNISVSDDSLNRCISVLRKILRKFDHGLSIKTHPKIGFHLEIPPSCELAQSEHHKTLENSQNNKPEQKAVYRGFQRPLDGILIALVLIIIAIFVVSTLLSSEREFKTTTTELNNRRVVVQPFKTSEELHNKYNGFYHQLVNRFANHPYHASVDLNSLVIDQSASPQQIGTELAARFVINGNITESKQRHILSWRLIDALSGDILLSKSLNLKLAEASVNANKIITDAIATIGKEVFSDNTEQYVNYIVESANYLFDHQGNWQTHQPILTLVAKAIVDVDPNSPLALKAMARFLIKTMWPLKYPNAPYASLATKLLEQAIELSPKDIEIYQLLAKAYMLQYQWSDATSIVTMALREFALSSTEISQLSAMVELGTLQVTPKLVNFLISAHRQHPLNSYYTSALVSTSLLLNEKQKALQLLDSLIIEQVKLGERSLPFGQLLWQQKSNEQGMKLIRNGISYLTLDKHWQQFSRQSKNEFDLNTILTNIELLNDTIVPNKLYLYAASGDIDNFYSLALSLADSKQFNPEVFISPNASLLMQDPRFKQLMDKIGLSNYWRSSVFPDFCTSQNTIAC